MRNDTGTTSALMTKPITGSSINNDGVSTREFTDDGMIATAGYSPVYTDRVGSRLIFNGSSRVPFTSNENGDGTSFGATMDFIKNNPKEFGNRTKNFVTEKLIPSKIGNDNALRQIALLKNNSNYNNKDFLKMPDGNSWKVVMFDRTTGECTEIPA
ncbi:MAG: hypothetical protein LUB59_07725 [Candidatus Gastranaerophilales bacterium]|nr:hypothetical protein [Candidatus Gastranaerophilales bacterium]